MTVIFFDGFSANRPRNEKYWGLAVAENEQLAGGSVYGSTEKKRNTTSVNSGAQKLTAFGDPAKQQAIKCFFGEQTNTRVIVGFAVSGVQIYPIGVDANGANLSSTMSRPLKLFELHNTAGSVVLKVDVEIATTATPNQEELRFKINDDAAFTLSSAEIYADVTNDSEAATFNTHEQHTFVLRETEDNEDFVYLEFAVDMTNGGESKVLFRFNDQPISVVNENNEFVEEMTLSAPIANVAAIKFYGGITKDMYIDDFYVLNSGGTSNTNFLGRETRILSPNLAATNTANWSVVSNQTPADPTLNVVDNENYITTSDPNQVSTFKPAANLTAPLVAAVAVTSYAKKTSLNVSYEHVYQTIGQEISTAGFVAANADSESNVNGTYCEDGTQNSRPKYKKAANNFYIYYNSQVNEGNGGWAIGPDLDENSYNWYYENGSTAATPPLNNWYAAPFGGMFSSAPTLTSQSCLTQAPDGAPTALGDPKTVSNLSYNCSAGVLCSVPHTTIIEQNPNTNAQWNIAEINSGSFGVRSLTPPA